MVDETKNEMIYFNQIIEQASKKEDKESEEEETSPKEILIATDRAFSTFMGRVEFSRDELDTMKKNFKKRQKKGDIPILYDHGYGSTTSAGWIKKLKTKEKDDGTFAVYADVEWTPQGEKDIKEKNYRYKSMGLFRNFTEYLKNDKIKEHGMTLMEVSLTNMPADRNIGDIRNLSMAGLNKTIIQNNAEEEAMTLETKTLNRNETNSKIVTEKLELQNTVLKLQQESNELKMQLKNSEEKIKLSERTTELEGLLVNKKITAAEKEDALKFSDEQYNWFIHFAKKSQIEAYSNEPKSSSKVDSEKSNDENKQTQDIVKLQEKYMNDNMSELEAYNKASLEVQGNPYK